EIRLLSNLETNQHKLLQLVMFGQPELNDILARHDMRQLKERITHNFTLGPLGRDETADYIDFRLRAAGYKGAPVFSPPALSLLAAASLGLTRRINILADKSLLAAYAAGRNEVGLEEAKAAIGDCDFSDAAPPPPVRRIRHAVAAGLGALSLALFAFWLRTEPPENAAAQATAPTAQAAPASATALPAPAAVPPAPPLAAPPVSLTEQRLAAGRAWLQQAEDEHWFIQLRAMNA